MLVIRYIALAVLAVWLGSMIVVLAGGATEAFLKTLPLIGYACGTTMLACLFVMKFVGPPPHAFVMRAALVFLMLVVTATSGLRRTAMAGTVANAALGMVLLFWYARE